MAWTSPMTFVAGQPLTAAQLNTHLRDNLFMTEVAKVSVADHFLVGTGRHSITQRAIGTARVNATETTTVTTEYVDLTTIGPQVKFTTGSKVLVFISCNIFNSSTASAGGMTFDIRGTLPDGSDGTSIDASDQWATVVDGVTLNSGFSATNAILMTTITPGLNAFTAKYKVGSGTGSFRYRDMIVFPF